MIEFRYTFLKVPLQALGLVPEKTSQVLQTNHNIMIKLYKLDLIVCLFALLWIASIVFWLSNGGAIIG